MTPYDIARDACAAAGQGAHVDAVLDAIFDADLELVHKPRPEHTTPTAQVWDQMGLRIEVDADGTMRLGYRGPITEVDAALMIDVASAVIAAATAAMAAAREQHLRDKGLV